MLNLLRAQIDWPKLYQFTSKFSKMVRDDLLAQIQEAKDQEVKDLDPLHQPEFRQLMDTDWIQPKLKLTHQVCLSPKSSTLSTITLLQENLHALHKPGKNPGQQKIKILVPTGVGTFLSKLLRQDRQLLFHNPSLSINPKKSQLLQC